MLLRIDENEFINSNQIQILRYMPINKEITIDLGDGWQVALKKQSRKLFKALVKTLEE